MKRNNSVRPDKPACIAILLLSILFTPVSEALCLEGERWEDMPNVIVMVITGTRNCDTIEDASHQYIPLFWNEVLEQGTLYTNLLDLNNQFHMPEFLSLYTGNIQYGTPGNILHRTISLCLREQKGLPKDQMWLMGHFAVNDLAATELTSFFKGSPEVKDILNKLEKDFMPLFSESQKLISWAIWDSLCVIHFNIYMRVLSELKPKLVFYIMHDVEVAHHDTYSKYVMALKRTDRYIYETFRFITTDERYRDNTYLIVLPDSGRDRYYMEHSQGTYFDPDRTWLYIFGPGIRKGMKIERPVHHTDVFYTLCKIFGIEQAIEKDWLHDSFTCDPGGQKEETGP